MTDHAPAPGDKAAAPSPSLGEGVPLRLQQRVDELLQAHEAPGLSAAHATRVAKVVLDQLVTDAAIGRSAALDLLVVDALVTRAIEMCAADPASLSAETERIISELTGGERE